MGYLDILVNSAGVSIHAPVEKIQTEDWFYTLAVNLTGPFLCCRAVLPHMMERGSGRIITIGSAASKMGIPSLGAYSASKFGVLGLTQSMAQEVAPRKITVNAICPGFIKTPIWGPIGEQLEHLKTAVNANISLKRLGTPQDVVPLALFLASPDSDYITGQGFNVTGGIRFH